MDSQNPFEAEKKTDANSQPKSKMPFSKNKVTPKNSLKRKTGSSTKPKNVQRVSKERQSTKESEQEFKPYNKTFDTEGNQSKSIKKSKSFNQKKSNGRTDDYCLLLVQNPSKYEIKPKSFMDKDGQLVYKNRNSIENPWSKESEQRVLQSLSARQNKKTYNQQKNDITVNFLHNANLPQTPTARCEEQQGKAIIQHPNKQIQHNLFNEEACKEQNSQKYLYRPSIEKYKANLKVWSKDTRLRQNPFGRMSTRENQMKMFNQSQVFSNLAQNDYYSPRCMPQNSDIPNFTNPADKEFYGGLRDYHDQQNGGNKKNLDSVHIQIKKNRDSYI